jgi:outer membrane protein assembly factor BamB
LFLTAGYGAGSMIIQIYEQAGAYSVEVVQQYLPKDGVASEQQTPILYQGHLFSILPKDAGPLREQFVCADLNDGKQILWSSGKTNRFGLGPYLIADGKFYILNDDGVLTIAKATIAGYEQLNQVQILEGQDAWGPMVIVNGRLLLRDSKRLVCVDVRENAL